MLPFLDEYLHTKNQRYRCIQFRDIDDQRILQSGLTRTFWPITCEVEFSQISGYTGKQSIVRSFILGYFQ